MHGVDSMIGVEVIGNKVSSGSMDHFLRKLLKKDWSQVLKKYAEAGVQALANATPVDSGKTAESWGYEIEETKSGLTIYWTNSNVNKHVNIAIIIQYGHATGGGGWVEGRDYINPALRPIFDQMADALWKEVSS